MIHDRDVHTSSTLDVLLRRVGLLAAALIMFNITFDMWLNGQAFYRITSLTLAFGGWMIGFTCFAAALIKTVSPRMVWMVLLAAILVMLGNVYLSDLRDSPLTTSHTDNEMITEYAVEALKRGENPYAWNFSDMQRVFRAPVQYNTFFLDGTPQYRVTYPALPVLAAAVFDRIGLGDLRVVNVSAHLALLILVFISTPTRWRPVVLLPILVFRDFVFLSLYGVGDVVWSLALVGMVIAWRYPLWRALLFGLACAFRQQPWFVAPFLLIVMWRQPGTRRERLYSMALFLSVSIGVFVVINLPFFIWSPEDWLRGALEPSYAAFNHTSSGLSVMTEYGLVPLPRIFYTVLQASILLIMLVVTWFYTDKIGQAFWVFPGIFFWLYYRGLVNYWIYWLPVILPVVAGELDRCLSLSFRSSQPVSRQWHTLVASLVIILTAGSVGLAGYYLRQDPPVELSYRLPIEMVGEQANRLTVSVSNTGNKTLTPRFFVRADVANYGLPWEIISGATTLAPGETGDFVISANKSYIKGFHYGSGAQLEVTDAGGDYTLRDVIYIPPQTNFDYPDRIANPDYRYWPQDGDAPLHWALITETGSVATLSIESISARPTLSLRMESNPHTETRPINRVRQTVVFPDHFAIWVYPTSTSADPADEVYGVEIVDELHRLWIVFGTAKAGITWMGENHWVATIQAPLNVWSHQMVDLRALYETLGWAHPLNSVRYKGSLRYVVPQVRLSLIAASRSRHSVEWFFGPIEQITDSYTKAALVDAALDHPDEYYVMIGDTQRQQRNYHLAIESYQQALAHNPTSSVAYFGLGESRFWLEDWPEAIEAFATAVMYDYPLPGLAYKGQGWAAYNLAQYHEALTAFETAIDLLSLNPGPDENVSLADAHAGAGWSWVKLGECDQAVPHFERALSIDDTLVVAQDGLTVCERP